MFSSLLAYTVFSLAIFSTAAAALVSRSSPGVGESFSLYAYGGSLGGLPLFYADGKALVGDLSNSTSSSASNVTFERTSSSSTSPLLGNPPNGTNSSSSNSTNPSWSDKLLYIPSSSSSSNEVGFTTIAETNETTTGFFFYGQTLMVNESDSGDLASSFYARSSSAQGEGVYSLLWNLTDTDDDDDTVFPVSLRFVPPSTA